MRIKRIDLEAIKRAIDAHAQCETYRPPYGPPLSTQRLACELDENARIWLRDLITEVERLKAEVAALQTKLAPVADWRGIFYEDD